MELFEQQGFHPRTDLGQNFLIDLNIIDFIVSEAQLGPDDVVLEVGAGTGGMSAFLAQQAGDVVSVEVDTNMHKLAQSVVGGYPNVTLLHTDALKNKNTLSPMVLDEVEHKLAVSPNRRLKLVSNLPYSIATPVVSNLVATELPWIAMIVTIQKELGQRMAAKPGAVITGALGLAAVAVPREADQDAAAVGLLAAAEGQLGGRAILPVAERRRHIIDREFFHDFVRRVFHQRRKLMRGVMAGMYRKQLTKGEIDDVLAQLEISPQARAEEMSVETLVALANYLYGRMHAVEAKGEG